NALLRRMGGPRFDLRDIDPIEHQPVSDPDDHEPICDVCGHYMEWVDCWQCGGKGGRDGDDLMEEDPMWYCEDDWEDCDICEGKGGYWECINLPHADSSTNDNHDVNQEKPCQSTPSPQMT